MNNDEPTSNGGLIRLRLDISYDGEFFNGWAKQEKLRTVQGELERIFGFIFLQRRRSPVRVGQIRAYTRAVKSPTWMSQKTSGER